MTNTQAVAKLAVLTDTKLAALYGQLSKAESFVDYRWEQIHTVAGDKKSWVGGTRVWNLTNDQAIVRVAVDIDKGQIAGSWIADLKAARTVVKGIQARIADLNEIFNAAPWSRFFLALTNSNGHIHSHMNCSTCNNGQSATEFGWNPELSGQTEAEAVEALGEILCSVCFPSAPVAWTTGISKTAQVAKDERAAKKAAKAPIFMVLDRAFNYTKVFKTQRAAEIALVGHIADNRSYGYALDSEAVAVVSERLAQVGVTAADIEARVAAKVARDFKAGEKHCASLGMTKQADGTWAFAR